MGTPDIRSLSDQTVQAFEEARKSAEESRVRADLLEEQFAKFRSASDQMVAERDATIEGLNEKLSRTAQALREAQVELQERQIVLDGREQGFRELEREHNKIVGLLQQSRTGEEALRVANLEAGTEASKALADRDNKIRRLQSELEDSLRNKRVIIRDPSDGEFAALRQQLDDERGKARLDIELANTTMQSAVEARQKLSAQVAALEKQVAEQAELIADLSKPRPANTSAQDARVAKLVVDIAGKEAELQKAHSGYLSVTGLADKRQQSIVDLEREKAGLVEQIEGFKVQLAASTEMRAASAAHVERLERYTAELEQQLSDEKERRSRDDALKKIGRG